MYDLRQINQEQRQKKGKLIVRSREIQTLNVKNIQNTS